MSDLVSHPDASTPSEGVQASDLFRRGRLGMGWSPAALARTALVTELTVLEWERGSRPIPWRVLSWVSMYSRPGADPDPSETPESLMV
jgi:hypothetical protein